MITFKQKHFVFRLSANVAAMSTMTVSAKCWFIPTTARDGVATLLSVVNTTNNTLRSLGSLP